MDSIHTIVCKLDPTPEQMREIDATLEAFASACNYIADVARSLGCANKVALQQACYREVRARFGLSANLTIRAIGRVCTAVKVQAKRHSTFSPTSIDFDQRIFSFREADWTFSLTLLHGRQRLGGLLGDFQRDALRGKDPTSATLVKRSQGGYFLHIQVHQQTLDPINVKDFLGVDLGMVNIATDSTGEIFTGKQTERNRRRRTIARKQYQRKGTKNAKRRLKKMAGRQARFQKKTNHEISKRLVAKAKAQSLGIALEDLQDIRTRVEATASKRFRRGLGNWSFAHLRLCIEYKAKQAAVPVVLVNPRNSSRTCSACGYCHKANRANQATFRCLHCGHSLNADENAALNISAWATRKPAPKAAVLASSINEG